MGKVKCRRTAWFGAAAVCVIFGISLVTSLPFAIACQNTALSPDALLYQDIATNLLLGRGFVQEVRSDDIVVPPLFPVLVAGVYYVFGHGNILAVLLVQCFLNGATACLVFLIGRELFNRWVGVLGALLYASYPIAAFFTACVLTETLFTFLVAVFAYGLVRLSRDVVRWSDALITGLAWGLGCLTRPHLLLFGPVLAAVVLLVRRGRSIKYAVVSTAIGLLIIMPWISYTYVSRGFFIPLASHGQHALWQGNSEFSNPREYYDALRVMADPTYNATLEYVRTLPAKEQGTFYLQEAIEYITSDPGRFVENTCLKALQLWKPVQLYAVADQRAFPTVPVPVLRSLVTVSDRALCWLLVPGLLLALSWGIRRHQLLFWILVYFTVTVSLGIIDYYGRYRLPIMPLAAIYGGVSLYVGSVFIAHLFVRVRRRLRKR